MKFFTALALTIATAACGVNYQIHPKGACPTPGVSPLASNCPTAAEMKGETNDGKSE
jgi:hypothetical protein